MYDYRYRFLVEPVIDVTTTTHCITYQYIPTRTNTHTQHRHITLPWKTFSISSTDTGPLLSKWHEACAGTPGQLFLHSGHQSKSELCAQREPTGRVLIVIVIEQLTRLRKRQKKQRHTLRDEMETHETRERKMIREPDMRREIDGGE